jgi:uncharacterized membrane protein YadS
MTFKLAESLNERADARLRSTIQRWPGRRTRELLPGLFLNLIMFAIRQLPGMAAFSPMMLSLIIGIVFHNIVCAAAWAKQGMTFSLRWLLTGAVAMGLGINIGRLIAKGFRPAPFGAFVLFIAGFSFTVIKLMGYTL